MCTCEFLQYLQGYVGGVDEHMSLDSVHGLLTAVIVGEHDRKG